MEAPLDVNGKPPTPGEALALPGGSPSQVGVAETERRGPTGETRFPPCLIGVPRFELGTSPTRTERATRLRHTPRRRRLAKERFDRLGAEVGALADQQVAAVGDHAKRRAEPAGEIESIRDG